jgi:hydrophobe/amphiphile efflux-1 (HAE1) family protein
MQWLARVSVRRPVFASVLILVILVIGIVGFSGLGVDKFPKVDFPAVTVTTLYPGASPSSVETDLTDPIEEAINTVSGIEQLTSYSSDGASMVVVQFSLDKDPDVAAQEIRDRLDLIAGDLPAGIEPVEVQKVDPDAAPVLMLSVKGNLPVRELTHIATDTVKAGLETVAGVGQIRVIGGQERRINIELDPVRMRAAGVTAPEVERAITGANVSVPGGTLDQGPVEASLRIDGRVGSPDELAALIVRQQGDRSIRVGDVAHIDDGVEEAQSGAQRDGTSAIVLAVRKQSGGNTVAVVDAVMAAAGRLEKRLPAGVTLEVVRDNSETIRTSTHTVLEHLVIGSILAAFVVLMFLGNPRSTIIAAVSIPISIIGTFALMAVAGFTLNMMTLLALALAVGIVIDDAIVVLENIHRYIHEKGMKPFPAAIAATKEIGLAVLATTLSLLAVFLPVAFMDGIVGRFLLGFGLTMAFAIFLSMLVSFTIVPMLSARMLMPAPAHGTAHKPPLLERIVDVFYKPLERVYMAMLRFSLRRRWVIVVACLAALATTPTLAKMAGFGFLPDNDEAHFEIFVEAPQGTSLDNTSVIAERIARETRAMPGVTHTLITIGDDDQERAYIAKIYVRLAHPHDRAMTQNEIMDEVRTKVLPHVPAAITVSVQTVPDISMGGGKNAAVQYSLSGPDLDQLEAYGSAIKAQLAQVPGAVDVDVDVPESTPEATMRPDVERIAAHDVDPREVTRTLRLLVGGDDISTFQERDEQYDVNLRAAADFRSDPGALGLITVKARDGQQVPLSELVTAEEGMGPSQINRMQRSRAVTISANVAPGHDQGSIDTALQRIVADLHLPAGYELEAIGQSREMGRTQHAFALAFLLSFVFMYLVLAAQFESWLHPLTILVSLPLTLPFAMASSVLFGQQLNIFSMLGLLVLFGMVKKNSILQIDQTNQLRAAGHDRHTAILEANRQRLRPILMTTLAFVAGMMPLVFSSGIGAGFSRAMATIVVGGQSMSLLLTLLAVPVVYTLFDDAGVYLGRLAGKLRRGARIDRGESEPEPTDAPAVGAHPVG